MKYLSKSQRVNVVYWATLIGGHAHFGLGEDEGVYIDTMTYVCTLKDCGMVRSLEIGKEIDVEIRKQWVLPFIRNGRKA